MEYEILFPITVKSVFSFKNVNPKSVFSYNFNAVYCTLMWRQNNKYSGLHEDFVYDNLDRLHYAIKGNDTLLKMSYDGNTGGITGKSDAGTFTYESSDKPYAIKGINPTTGLVPSYYQSIKYNSFNCVDSISENGYKAEFYYNSDNSRARMDVKQNGYVFLSRWYPSANYIKETSGNNVKEYTFIGGDAYSAPVVAVKQNNSVIYYNILRDHLGSITHIVDSTGSVIAEYSYDAWGRMRNPSNWANYSPNNEPQLVIVGKGFTGHEHLPWFNTINMNGRLYDPLNGMFLSPDKYLQRDDNSQNYNKFSYCLNNPLKYFDPTGQRMESYGDPDNNFGPHIDYHSFDISNQYENNSSTGGGVILAKDDGKGYYYDPSDHYFKDKNGQIVKDWNIIYYVILPALKKGSQEQRDNFNKGTSTVIIVEGEDGWSPIFDTFSGKNPFEDEKCSSKIEAVHSLIKPTTTQGLLGIGGGTALVCGVAFFCGSEIAGSVLIEAVDVSGKLITIVTTVDAAVNFLNSDRKGSDFAKLGLNLITAVASLPPLMGLPMAIVSAADLNGKFDNFYKKFNK